MMGKVVAEFRPGPEQKYENDPEISRLTLKIAAMLPPNDLEKSLVILGLVRQIIKEYMG